MTEVIEATTTDLVANSAADLSGFQGNLRQWATEKLVAVRQEFTELDTACTEAKRKKWSTRALAKAAKNALGRVTFYEKVDAAIEAGYMLFPPVPNADVIAIRTYETDGDYKNRESSVYHSSQPSQETQSEAPVLGDGEYKDPWIGWRLLRRFKNDKGEDRKEWETVTELKSAEFPLAMAKPEIVQAVNAAMEMKIFDEIRLFPFTKRKGDPCILGVVFNPREARRHYFLISWRINKSDL